MARLAVMDRWRPVLFLVVIFSCLSLSLARPVVRNVKTNDEFKKLLKHHAENTGLPVVVDFYSDGCGHCRYFALVSPFIGIMISTTRF